MLELFRPAVLVHIKSGTGNQMFLYAAALCLAARLKARIYCNTDFYHRNRKRVDRPLTLPTFGIDLLPVPVPKPNPVHRMTAAIGIELNPLAHAERLESQKGYDPQFRAITGSAILTGYFQSWRYFEGYEQLVKATFDPDLLPDDGTQTTDAIRRARHPVAVHVRRGDYRRYPDLFLLLDREYYDQARAALALPDDATFFVFSDEPEAARDLLRDWPRTVFVSGHTPLEELRLMSSCRDFIVANSTFSWWGAWLGKAGGKRVVAPSRWFLQPDPPNRVDDLLPPEWIRIDN